MSRFYISHSASQEMSYQKSVIFNFFLWKAKKSHFLKNLQGQLGVWGGGWVWGGYSWLLQPGQSHICWTCVCVSHSVVSNSLLPQGLLCARLLHPGEFPGMYIRVDFLFLLQGISLAQGLNPGLLHCKQTLLSEPQGKSFVVGMLL